MKAVSRRSLLGGGALVAVGAGAGALALNESALPSQSWFYRHLGLDGADGRIPTAQPGRRVSGVMTSKARGGQPCGWTVVWPPGARQDLPVAVVLHGRDNNHTSAFSDSYLALDRYLAAAIGRGTPPFALASVDGGDTYWHARADGSDAAAMVVDEFLPLLARQGLDVDLPGFLGWSMGGYGVLHIAGMLGASRAAVVTAMSPALWYDYEDTAPGAFDDRLDFADATVMGRQPSLDGIAVRVDCGLGDPFAAATRDYREGFERTPAGGLQRGDHDLGYWRRMAGPHVEFLGAALSRRVGA